MPPERPPRPRTRLPALIAAVAAGWWAATVSWAYLVNSEGPMGGAARWAPVVVLVVVGAVGRGVFVMTRAVTRRSRVAGAGCAVVAVAVAWVLAPTVVETHRSFVERSDRTATCSGWQFHHYPPDTSDAAGRQYCVGIERAVGG